MYVLECLGRSQESEVITKPFRYEEKGINRGASWGREALCGGDSGGFVLRAACFYFRFLTPDSGSSLVKGREP